MSDDEYLFQCVLCGLSEGDATNLTTQSSLQVNATIGCGHAFCCTCVERELSRRKTFPCPICQTIQVKRTTLSTKSLDTVLCSKDTEWRRRILKVFNKVQGDFTSLLEYNNYLEQVEDYIFAIVNEEPHAEEVKLKIKKYEEENKKLIVIRQSQRADEDRSLMDRIAREQRETERIKRERIEEEKMFVMAKKRLKVEATQVSLGERDEVSRDVIAAQMLGYRNELLKNKKNLSSTTNSNSSSSTTTITSTMTQPFPRVREPPGGYIQEKSITRESYLRRQAAGGGIKSGSTEFFERNWNIAISTLFQIPS